jgi:hypothetical protein
MGLWDTIKGALGGLFGGGGGGGGGMMSGINSANIPSLGFGGAGKSAMSAIGGGGGGGGFGGLLSKGMSGLGNMFGGGATGSNGIGSKNLGGLGLGLASMFGSQMIGNPKQPALGEDYNQYMNMMKSGGTPGMQSANQYYQGVLSGNNKDMYDAATYSLDNTYEDEKKNLISMYKTLRPGTDPATDSTFNRDLSALEDRYARARAQTMAQVQQGAASGAAGLGSQQMGGLQQGLNPQLQQAASGWQADLSKKQMLMSGMSGIGQSLIGNSLDPNAQFNQMWQQQMMKKMLAGGV